jgi:hypothetical protein
MTRLQRIFLFLVLAWLATLTLRLAFTARIGHDDIEHLHTAWLMLQGQQPYLDFFQKQSPLFWWLLIPLLSFADGDLAIALFLGRGLMLVALAASSTAIWLLAREALRRKGLAHAALLLLWASPVVLYNMLVIRPDGVMIALLLWALVFATRGLSQGRRALLVPAGICLGLACSFLLKAAPVSLAAATALAYIGWHQDSRSWRGALRNLVLLGLGALIAILPFIVLLAATGQLEPFIYFNITFNGAIYSHPWPGDVPWWTRFSTLLLNEVRQEPWLLAGAIGSNLLWIGLLPVPRHQAARNRFLLLIALFWAGVVVLAANRLPFYSYFLLPLLTGAVFGPVIWSKLATRMESHRVVWVSPRRKRTFSPARVLAPVVVIAIVVTSTYWHNRFTTNEGQLDKLSSLPRVEAVHEMPRHPVFAFDSHRIWDNVERYKFAFRQLSERGDLPKWAAAIYESEFRQ